MKYSTWIFRFTTKHGRRAMPLLMSSWPVNGGGYAGKYLWNKEEILTQTINAA